MGSEGKFLLLLPPASLFSLPPLFDFICLFLAQALGVLFLAAAPAHVAAAAAAAACVYTKSL